MSKVDGLFYLCECCGVVPVGSERNANCKYKTMSKVEAYICDCCGRLFKEEATVGLSRQEDLFDKLAGYPTIPNPSKAFLHYSVECYREQVLIPASNLVDRKRDERAYELKVKELAFALRRKSVFNYNERQRLRQTKKKS